MKKAKQFPKQWRYTEDCGLGYKRGKLFNGWFIRHESYYHYVNGKLHNSNDCPAIIAHDYKEYYKNGNLHRNNGPARVTISGNEWWCQNGKLHREDGPATIKKSFIKNVNGYYLNGESCKKRDIKKLQLIKKLAGLK